MKQVFISVILITLAFSFVYGDDFDVLYDDEWTIDVEYKLQEEAPLSFLVFGLFFYDYSITINNSKPFLIDARMIDFYEGSSSNGQITTQKYIGEDSIALIPYAVYDDDSFTYYTDSPFYQTYREPLKEIYTAAHIGHFLDLLARTGAYCWVLGCVPLTLGLVTGAVFGFDYVGSAFDTPGNWLIGAGILYGAGLLLSTFTVSLPLHIRTKNALLKFRDDVNNE